VKDRLVADGGGGPSTSGVRSLKNPPVSGNKRANNCC